MCKFCHIKLEKFLTTLNAHLQKEGWQFFFRALKIACRSCFDCAMQQTLLIRRPLIMYYITNCCTCTTRLLQFPFLTVIFRILKSTVNCCHGNDAKRAIRMDADEVMASLSSVLSTLELKRQLAYSHSSIELVSAVENKYPLSDIIMARCAAVVVVVVVWCALIRIPRKDTVYLLTKDMLVEATWIH